MADLTPWVHSSHFDTDAWGADDWVNYARACEAEVSRLSARVRELEGENGRMRGQISEALSIVHSGTDYERAHLSGILAVAAPKEGEDG